MKILGLIPVRGGSKGVPRKNVKILGNKPLIAYTLESAKHSNLLTDCIVSTEDKEIAEIVGISVKAVEKRMHLALLKMKDKIGDV